MFDFNVICLLDFEFEVVVKVIGSFLDFIKFLLYIYLRVIK